MFTILDDIRTEQLRIVVQGRVSQFVNDLVDQEFSFMGDDAQRLWDKIVDEDICVNPER